MLAHVRFRAITFHRFFAFQLEDRPRGSENRLRLRKWCNTFSVKISFGCSLLLVRKKITKIIYSEVIRYKFYLLERTPNSLHSHRMSLLKTCSYCSQRIQLFHSYATHAMCRAGIKVLDMYPLSAAYPKGTSDNVHYEYHAFYPAVARLEDYFLQKYNLSDSINSKN